MNNNVGYCNSPDIVGYCHYNSPDIVGYCNMQPDVVGHCNSPDTVGHCNSPDIVGHCNRPNTCCSIHALNFRIDLHTRCSEHIFVHFVAR